MVWDLNYSIGAMSLLVMNGNFKIIQHILQGKHLDDVDEYVAIQHCTDLNPSVVDVGKVLYRPSSKKLDESGEMNQGRQVA